MLKDTSAKRSRTTCKVYCKKCCRREFHFLNIRGRGQRFLVRTLTLGLIGLVGQYRCVCCGTPRIGRFDIVRGGDQRDADFSPNAWNPVNWWFNRRDSWERAQRKSRRNSSSRKRRKKDDHSFKRNGW